jgi:hypothetical protein
MLRAPEGSQNIAMIDRCTIKAAPALKHADILKKLAAGEQPGPNDLANLAKVKAKVEIVGDYADMEKVRDLLKGLSKAG